MLLPYLIITPFIGGLVCCLVDHLSIKASRLVALITALIILLLSLQCWFGSSHLSVEHLKWWATFSIPWIPRFGISFHLALDGLSFLMITLTSFLSIISIICSWDGKYQGSFYLCLLSVVGSTIGIFLSVDLLLFFFFWEVILIPMYFLISIWGNDGIYDKKCIASATRFFLYAQVSGLVMLAAILTLVVEHHKLLGIWTFDYERLLETPISYSMSYFIMLGFFISFTIKIPVVPIHGWLIDTHYYTPNDGSVDLVGLILKTSIYGLMRFSLPLFPDTSLEFAPIAMFIGVISIFYSAWMAFSQTDIKRFIGYTSVSHMGLVIIAIYAENRLALQGALVQMVSHALSSAALLIICGQIYKRLHTRDMSKMGGLWSHMRWISGFSLFFSAANMGIPGTSNFVGEFMILVGSFQSVPLIVSISAFSLVFASVYSLIFMQRIYYGRLTLSLKLSSLSLRELTVLIALALPILILGVYPKPVLDASREAIGRIYQYESVLTTTSA